jgi:type I restriction enzyme R subunit
MDAGSGEELRGSVTGMPNNSEGGKGFRGLRALGRRRQAARPGGSQAHQARRRKVGQQQAKLYADCLQAQYGQRP